MKMEPLPLQNESSDAPSKINEVFCPGSDHRIPPKWWL